MNPGMLLIPIILPIGFAIISFLLPSKINVGATLAVAQNNRAGTSPAPTKIKALREIIFVIGAIIDLYFAWVLFAYRDLSLSIPWLGSGIDFDLRLYHFSGFILLWLNIFTLLITLFSTIKLAGHHRIREYYGYLFLTVALANGAVLANNFIILLFFWEGLLLTLYALITLGSKEAHRTAVKSFIISGFCDFCLILGITILWSITGTAKLSEISISAQLLWFLY